MIISQDYTLDLIPSGKPLVVHVSQYDKDSRQLNFTLTKGGVAFNGGALNRAVIGTKPDGHGFYYDLGTSVGNVVQVTVTDQMTACAGNVECEIRLIGGTNILGTANFTLAVEPSALDENTVISDSDLPIFEQLVQSAQASANSAHQSASEASASASSVSGLADQIATNTANIALKANIASPALTGNPTAPTQTAGNNSTRIATTAFVKTAVDNYDSGRMPVYFFALSNDKTLYDNYLDARAQFGTGNIIICAIVGIISTSTTLYGSLPFRSCNITMFQQANSQTPRVTITASAWETDNVKHARFQGTTVSEWY